MLAGLLIILSWWGVYSAQRGLVQRSFTVEGIPMQFMAAPQAGQHPGVLVAHGFSGSKQLMLGYAHVLAQNGYSVLLWDLPGHGANTQPFVYDHLQSSFDVALSTLQQQPEVDAARLAAVGHSMGGGVVLQGGIEHGDILDAIVAISSTDAPVTPELPKNMSLQLGEWESYLLKYAQQLLQQAGGANADLSAGKGRSLAVIPAVEHATILFSDVSHRATLDWLNQTFNLTPVNTYQDRRMAWYGLHLLGWMMAAAVLLTPQQAFSPHKHPLQAWGGLLLAPIVAGSTLKAINLQISIDALGGLFIGGALGVWMLVAGLTWLGVMAGRSLTTLAPPTLSEIRTGAIGFALLWIGLGAIAQWVWLPWFLTAPRLLLWLVITLACVPWFLASGLAQSKGKWGSRLGWWLGQSLIWVVGLTGTIVLLPSLGFLGIMLPVFPVLTALFSFIAARTGSAWGYCLACAPILSWLIVTPFPVV
jgi:pimeloyl-ACP methyl ester carboxylesterase